MRPCGSRWTDYNATKMIFNNGPNRQDQSLLHLSRRRGFGAAMSVGRKWCHAMCALLSSAVPLAAHCAQPHPLEWDVMALTVFIIQSTIYGVLFFVFF
jgi:hypothetical protein